MISRRSALKGLAAGAFAPFAIRTSAHAAPSDTLRHASFGASGMAGSDIGSLTASKNLKLVAVADVDLRRAEELKSRFPDVKIYQDWRELLDRERDLDSANISTPDHMHAPITMTALQRGLNVYTQKPLTQTIYEARRLAEVAREKGVVSQMGIQIHSHEVHRTVVATVRSGVLGKVTEVYSWSGKQWGDRGPRPDRKDPVPAGLDWNAWLGVAGERPYVEGYYHPGEWRKRLDFGTGTFGDMGCHILDPVFSALELTAPGSVRGESGKPNADSWGLDCEVRYEFPGTKHTAERVSLTWYDGEKRPPAEVIAKIGKHALGDQGSIYIGTEGVMYSPYIAMPILLPEEKFKDARLINPGGEDHYLQFVEACRGKAKTSTPFSYSGPLTESVLLGCLATRFPGQTLEWDAQALRVTNVEEPNRFVRKRYREGWAVQGL